MSIVQELNDYKKKDIYPFHMPGHKRRLAPSTALKDAYEIDITEIDGFDNLHVPTGIIMEAQNRAAKVFGADNTYFLVNGTTVGILASVYAAVGEGDYCIMARNCHKCVYNAVMLSGATPIYIYPDQEAYFEINSGISAAKVQEAFESIEGDIKDKRVLVIITSPTYEGVLSDVAQIKQVCSRYNATLLVDGAHGAHLGFSEDFPQSAHKCGADIEVVSVHKTLPAPTQTALIHISNEVSFKNRILQMLSVFETSSPSYILMSGIDALVSYLWDNAEEAFRQYCNRIYDFIGFSKGLNNINVLTVDKLTSEGSADFDISKIVISDKSGRFSGKELYDILLNTYKLQPEMASGSYVVLMTSIADDNKGFARLKEALSLIDKAIDEGSEIIGRRNFVEKIYDRIVGKKMRKSLFGGLSLDKDYFTKGSNVTAGKRVASPKEILFNDEKEWERIELCEDRIAADYIMIYPPGIPIVAPGERLTGEVIDKLLEADKQGLNIIGVNESKEIEVLWEKSST